MANTTAPKFVRWAVLIGIVIALNIFFLVARSLVLPEPKYDDYCPTRIQPAATEDACVKQDGVWVATPNDASVTAVTKPNMAGYCDLYQKCQPVYDAAQKQFRLYAFIIAIGLGVLSLIVGVLPIGSSIVSSGLSYGGVLALIIGAIQYWNDASSLIQLGISALALGALLYIGVKRFRD
ncbi:MAG: hypothetical protein ABA06_01575 [Parcubacteria bacterium C7867-001]|nr:MAG: hypothetical protein ABA06_01575 [Parcubacteria bacterium C7867-001]